MKFYLGFKYREKFVLLQVQDKDIYVRPTC